MSLRLKLISHYILVHCEVKVRSPRTNFLYKSTFQMSWMQTSFLKNGVCNIWQILCCQMKNNSPTFKALTLARHICGRLIATPILNSAFIYRDRIYFARGLLRLEVPCFSKKTVVKIYHQQKSVILSNFVWKSKVHLNPFLFKLCFMYTTS